MASGRAETMRIILVQHAMIQNNPEKITVDRVSPFLRRNPTHPKGIIHRMSDYAVLIRPTGGCCLGHRFRTQLPNQALLSFKYFVGMNPGRKSNTQATSRALSKLLYSLRP